MLGEQHSRIFLDRGRDIDISRTGSAPPTVAGSVNALGSLFENSSHFSEGITPGILDGDDIHLNPETLSCYFTKKGIIQGKPWKENWVGAERLQTGSASFFSQLEEPWCGVDNEPFDRRKVIARNFTKQVSAQWPARDVNYDEGLSGGGLGRRRKSFAESLQDELVRQTPFSGHSSHQVCEDVLMDSWDKANSIPDCFQNGLERMDSQNIANSARLSGLPNGRAYSLPSVAVMESNLPRSKTPDYGYNLPPFGFGDPYTVRNGLSSSMTKLDDIAAILSNLRLSRSRVDEGRFHPQLLQDIDTRRSLSFDWSRNHDHGPILKEHFFHNLGPGQPSVPRRTSSSIDLYTTASPFEFCKSEGSNSKNRRASTHLRNRMQAPRSSGCILSPQAANLFTHRKPTLPSGQFSFFSSSNSDLSFNMNRRSVSPSIEEFNANKHRYFELSDIVDHVLDFSMDQHGSRFLQQKLETATLEEKDKIFCEIVPHARSLMTDVFGNYVIQKFFEHGTEIQRRKLADHLIGHVLPLSLQMYGCRVIQKALEMVGLDQQIQMVEELDGSVMKCVCDQNGNHVIQKCIECVPQDRIQFIISKFHGQVLALATHPYGCRVIQRVLEHCTDTNTQQIIMEEIIESACDLAQDQYGNYVIQHVLEHGKACERAAIINKLAGHVVNMSQQKFASNVVEKCLSFGSREEQELLVNGMLGSTEENENLQEMMKNPYGNYVVQKVLETCSNHIRELVLSRIKAQLTSLKKYTYGKHIVSRVEKLVTAGEKHLCPSLHS